MEFSESINPGVSSVPVTETNISDVESALMAVKLWREQRRSGVWFDDIPGPAGLRSVHFGDDVTIAQRVSIMERNDASNKARLVRFNVARCICCGGPARETGMH
jgi:hypothetical protein